MRQARTVLSTCLGSGHERRTVDRERGRLGYELDVDARHQPLQLVQILLGPLGIRGLELVEARVQGDERAARCDELTHGALTHADVELDGRRVFALGVRECSPKVDDREPPLLILQVFDSLRERLPGEVFAASYDPRPVRSARKFVPQLPPALANMLDECLRKKRDRRAADLTRAVCVLESHLGLRSPAAGQTERRDRRWLATLAVLASACAALIGLALSDHTPSETRTWIVPAPAEDALPRPAVRGAALSSDAGRPESSSGPVGTAAGGSVAPTPAEDALPRPAARSVAAVRSDAGRPESSSGAVHARVEAAAAGGSVAPAPAEDVLPRPAARSVAAVSGDAGRPESSSGAVHARVEGTSAGSSVVAAERERSSGATRARAAGKGAAVAVRAANLAAGSTGQVTSATTRARRAKPAPALSDTAVEPARPTSLIIERLPDP